MLFKIVGLAIITASLCLYLKSINSDFFILALIAGGTIITLFSIDYLANTISFFKQFASTIGIQNDLIMLCVKVLLIGYLVEFACGTIEDSGLKSLSDKVAVAGRLIMLGVSVPVFASLLKMISAFLDKI